MYSKLRYCGIILSHNHMNISPFKALHANIGMINSCDTFFENVKDEFLAFQKSGFYDKLNLDAYYILKIKTQYGTHTGLLCGVDIKEYLEGNILIHENTLSSKEQKMVHLFLKRKAFIKPVLLTYPTNNTLQQKLSFWTESHKPLMRALFEKSKEIHDIFAINDPELIREITDFFKENVPQAYIADGHHRCSTAAYLYNQYQERGLPPPTDKIFSALFAMDQLTILDYNRMVDCLHLVSPARLLAALSRLCYIDIEDTPKKPTCKHEWTLFIGRECFRLRWKKDVLNQYKDQVVRLDATILDEQVFQNILGIKDVKTDQKIEYIEGAKGLNVILEKVLKKETSIGICLYPVDIQEVVTIADHHQIMPPKSTWFEPRIKNGLLVFEF